MKSYIFPIITVLLLALFFLGLPDPEKTKIRKGNSRIDRKDLLIMAVITVIFAFVDFCGLGSRTAPETFAPVGGTSFTIELSGDSPELSEIHLYTGVGVGTYDFEYSADGVFFSPVAEFDQNYVEILKWETVAPSDISHPNFIRITVGGTAWLGELVLVDSGGNAIPYRSSLPDICDEQEKLCLKQTYLNSSYFDEIYHARTAWEHLNRIYPYELSHPPLGKIIISLGVLLFGMNPFGWRFMGTLFGVLMLPILYVFCKKLFSSRRAAVGASLLLGTDFLHFVQTRIATIDSYGVFFILLMYLFMFLYISEDDRKYLAMSGISFGIGAACKWTCIFAGAGLALIWLCYRIRRRSEGWKALMKNVGFCVIFFILIPSIIYYLSYIPYGLAMGCKSIFSKAYFKTVVDNQTFMFNYHSMLVAEHPYSSVWYQWIFDIKPILYYLEYLPDDMRSSFGAFMNPLICWGGLLAFPILVYSAIFKKENRAAFLLIAYLAQLIPWIFITRLTFEYHYFPCSVFLIMAIGYIFSLMEAGSKHYKAYITSFCAVSALLFLLFYPVLSGHPVSNEYQHMFLHWLPSWPF